MYWYTVHAKVCHESCICNVLSLSNPHFLPVGNSPEGLDVGRREAEAELASEDALDFRKEVLSAELAFHPAATNDDCTKEI